MKSFIFFSSPGLVLIFVHSVFEKDGARVVVQKQFLPVLQGSTVDYEVEMEREGFKITDNPQAKSSCGCARSFTPEQYNKL